MDEKTSYPVLRVDPTVERLVGTVTREWTSDPVSLRHIREYVAGIGGSTDLLPSGDDADAIADVVAPPLFFLSACRQVVSEDALDEDGQHAWAGVHGIDGRSVIAGSRAEFRGHVRVGDVLHATQRLSSVRQRNGRNGPLVIVETDTEFHNQRGEHVGSHGLTLIFR